MDACLSKSGVVVENGYLFTAYYSAVNIDKIVGFRLTGAASFGDGPHRVEAIVDYDDGPICPFITHEEESKQKAYGRLIEITKLIQKWKEANRATELQQDV